MIFQNESVIEETRKLTYHSLLLYFSGCQRGRYKRIFYRNGSQETKTARRRNTIQLQIRHFRFHFKHSTKIQLHCYSPVVLALVVMHVRSVLKSYNSWVKYLQQEFQKSPKSGKLIILISNIKRIPIYALYVQNQLFVCIQKLKYCFVGTNILWYY